MTNIETIGAALRQALRGEVITETSAFAEAVREMIRIGDMHLVGCEAVLALVEFTQSDIQAQRELLRLRMAGGQEPQV